MTANKIHFKKFIFGFILTLSCLLATTCSYAKHPLISLFPLAHYDQHVSTWLKPSDPNYNQPLLDANQQQQRLTNFRTHWLAPWDKTYVNKILTATSSKNNPDLQNLEQSIVVWYSNKDKSADKIGYGENFRPHTVQWINAIAANMQIDQLAPPMPFTPMNYAIALNNIQARVLPTHDVHFYSHNLAGQGYPFDNLQDSAVWAGTPLYVIQRSHDNRWSLVITPAFIAWVPSDAIARAGAMFRQAWENNAKHHLAAITKTKTSIVDTEGVFHFAAYVGAVFPAKLIHDGKLALLIPAADTYNRAYIKYAIVPAAAATLMPLTATPHHFAELMHTLINRPYGWGGMYFYNDCSAELKSLFTPFGIWLSRHSSAQGHAGKMVDMSSADMDQRLQYLKAHGHKLMTIVYVGGHIILFVGNVENPNPPHGSMILTYQNLWGLFPADKKSRVVIGESVLFPLLKQYPEDPTLMSLANKKYFQVSYLDQLPPHSLLALKHPNLKALVLPGGM